MTLTVLSERDEVQVEPYRAPSSLDEALTGSPYVGYAYSYPHKTAYAPLAPPRPLREVWAKEPTDAIFLYAHIPFCEMRCGFCNLFTQVRPRDFDSLQDRYLDALSEQAARVLDAVEPQRAARFAVGGGTPTQLSAKQLERLYGIASRFGVDASTYTIIETSPDTATTDKLEILRGHGVNRVSMGVQSFDQAELAAAGRPTSVESGRAAIERIRAVGFPTLNLDLIYGIDGQTVASFLHSIEEALQYEPQELFLYPLYVRERTGLGRRARAWTDGRLEQYRAARARLLDAGYEQISMRFFRRRDAETPPGDYSCQADGMIGLGCGARSYTRSLHYSEEWAVGKNDVRGIIEQWIARDGTDFEFAWHGAEVPVAEQQRRFVIQSLLHREGLSLAAYTARFGTQAQEDVAELGELLSSPAVTRTGDTLSLTEAGLERSDAIGPYLYSKTTRGRSEAYTVR